MLIHPIELEVSWSTHHCEVCERTWGLAMFSKPTKWPADRCGSCDRIVPAYELDGFDREGQPV